MDVADQCEVESRTEDGEAQEGDIQENLALILVIHKAYRIITTISIIKKALRPAGEEGIPIAEGPAGVAGGGKAGTVRLSDVHQKKFFFLRLSTFCVISAIVHLEVI